MYISSGSSRGGGDDDDDDRRHHFPQLPPPPPSTFPPSPRESSHAEGRRKRSSPSIVRPMSYSDEKGIIKEKMDLSPFVDAFGNYDKQNGHYYIALRFRQPVVSYMCYGYLPDDIRPPENTCVVLHASTNPSIIKSASNLFFSVKTPKEGSYLVPDTSERALLRSLFFPHADSIVVSAFHSSTLYVAARKNPFRNFWTKCRRDESFRTLGCFFRACRRDGAAAAAANKTTKSEDREVLDLREIAKLRFFKRNAYDPRRFNTWHALAVRMCGDGVREVLNSAPSAKMGLRIHRILERSEKHGLPEDHPPADFYTCGILLTDAYPLGVIFQIKRGRVAYVSPMVVAYSENQYKDCNYVACTEWMPLLRDLEHMKRFVLPWYIRNDRCKKIAEHLPQVIAWVSVQTADPYRRLLSDLEQVYFLLYGHSPKSRWLSNPSCEL